jgi:hypothetical protein
MDNLQFYTIYLRMLIYIYVNDYVKLKSYKISDNNVYKNLCTSILKSFYCADLTLIVYTT